MSKLSTFIRDNTEQILEEWETFARTLPMGDSMNIAALRDHAKEILTVIARDLDTPQTQAEETDKAKGKSDAHEEAAPTAAQQHGAGRAGSGFSIEQMVSEFRALRASVIRLWTKQQHRIRAGDLEDMTRFNEGIDQAIAESITRYTHEIDQSKERFIAILGHDLRTPMGAIITSSQFILDTAATTGEIGEPYRTLITRIGSSARRMNQLVADLLEFTRTSFGEGIPVVRAEMDVKQMLDDVVAEVSASYPGRTVQVEAAGDVHGQWDRERLTQALTNLVGNAVQHGSENRPITVVARGVPTEVVIAVHNEGPPIPEEQLAEIFQATKQSKTKGARESSHLGIGLYVVDQIVAAHGGSIEIRSTREEGTTFTVHLPRTV